MDFWQTVMVVFRRWYITFPAFLAAVGVAGLVYGSVPTQYVSTSLLVLTTPRTGPTAQSDAKRPYEITNPLLNFEYGLSLSASILIQTLGTPETAASLGVSPNGDTSYLVSNGSTNPESLISGPFVFIQGTSSAPQPAQDIVRRVSALAVQNLTERQKELKAPASTFITVNEVVPPTTPEAQRTNKQRAAGAAGTLAVLASLAAGFAFESIVTSRKQRRAGTLAALARLARVFAFESVATSRTQRGPGPLRPEQDADQKPIETTSFSLANIGDDGHS